MTATLILQSNNSQNPLVLDLSRYLDLTPDSDLDPQNPSFSNKVISHSLLKEGGVLALEDFQAKELVFPVKLNAATNVALQQLVQQINQACTSPGATYSWTPPGASQATVFDAISGELDVKYKYREDEKQWCTGELKLFTQPFGRVAGPRPYAAASAVGPLLMITPYASSGAVVIGASTQAGVAGFGGQQQGASSGVFYSGTPSLAGDAPALLQISYAPAFQTISVGNAPVPPMAMSLLPDGNYRALQTTANITAPTSGPSPISQGSAVAGQYWSLPASQVRQLQFSPVPGIAKGVPISWAGPHRLMAIARASQAPGVLIQLTQTSGGLGDTYSNPAASVAAGDWQLYDLGTFSLRSSQYPALPVLIAASAGGKLDVTALVMLPDNATWFTPTVFPFGPGAAGGPAVPRPAVLADDLLGDQFAFTGSATTAPTPIGSVPSSLRITQYTRGLIPRPDPKNGLPVLAILSAGIPGQTNPQNQPVSALVNVLERARYVMP